MLVVLTGVSNVFLVPCRCDFSNVKLYLLKTTVTPCSATMHYMENYPDTVVSL